MSTVLTVRWLIEYEFYEVMTSCGGNLENANKFKNETSLSFGCQWNKGIEYHVSSIETWY